MRRFIATVGFLAGIFCLVAKGPLRDLVQNHGFEDYGLTGFLPSYLSAVSLSLLFSAMLWKKGKNCVYGIIAGVITGSLLYEFFPFSSARVFDYVDVLAIVAGGLTALFIVRFVMNKRGNNAGSCLIK